MFKHELYKVLFNKTSIAFIIVIFVVNALQLIWIEDNNYWYSGAAYSSLWKELEMKTGDSTEEWQVTLDELKAEFQRMREMDFSEINSMSAKYTGSIVFEIELYARVIKEIEAPLGYETYLKEIELTKKRYETLGNLMNRDNYVFRNLMMTAELYAELEPITLIPESSAGVKMAVGSHVTDFLVLALFVFFGISIWLKEKEQGVINLIRTTKNGRIKLAVSKIGVFSTVCAMCGSMLYFSNIIISELYYGLGDLSRSIATIDEYRGTLWRISILEFLVFNLLIKLMAYIWLALLFSVICTGVSGSLAAFGITALMSAGSYVMYTNIPALSAFAVFKYLNPFGMIKTELIFQEFKGLNIWGYPFDYRKCVAVVLFVGCGLFVFLTTRLFVRPPIRSGIRMPAFVGKITYVFISLRRRFERHVSIVGHEFYRIFISGGILFVTVAALVFGIASNQPFRVRYMNLSEYYERQYLEKLAGPVTDEKKEYLASELERLKRPADDNEQEQKKAVNEVLSRLSYLEENEGTYFIYDEPFGLLTAAEGNQEDITQTVFFMVLMALSMPTFFAPEWQTGMRKVVSVTMHGKRKLVYVRYITGILLVLALFLISYLPPFMQVISSYEVKAELFTYPAGSLIHLADYGVKISIGTYLFIVGTLRFVSGILATLFIYKISAFIKSYIYTMAAAFAVLLVPTLLAMLDRNLEFAMYPYSAFAGNMALQNIAAAITCVAAVTVVIVTGMLWTKITKKR